MKYFLVLLCLVSALCATEDIRFVIVTPTYNNEKWCIKNIQSVIAQTYNNWHMVIINDCSTDATSDLINSFIIKHGLSEHITLINNKKRKGALKNIFNVIHASPDNTVIITLDGDDWFANEGALSRLALEYQDPAVWLTYGQWKGYPNNMSGQCCEFPGIVKKEESFRSYRFITSHVRSFYAWLFKSIKKEDLLYKGKFFAVAWDVAMMLPMLEMAAKNHYRFIPDVLYIYNMANPLNDFKHSQDLQIKCDQYVRSLLRYAAL